MYIQGKVFTSKDLTMEIFQVRGGTDDGGVRKCDYLCIEHGYRNYLMVIL